MVTLQALLFVLSRLQVIAPALYISTLLLHRAVNTFSQLHLNRL